ncbi:MAG: cell surface protein SprA [Fibrobacterota bacterium]|nr:cell surface protein SprA [Fibrobacterota bacterium]
MRRFFPALFCLALGAAPGDAIYIEQQSYLQVPDAAKPLDELLPQKGVESTGGRGLLQVNSIYLKRRHNVNFETREVEIIRYVELPPAEARPGSRDTTPVWQSYYRELNSYNTDMSELALRRLWLNQFMGKEEPSQAGGPGMLDIVLPVNVPDWMKRIGVDKPRLRINGSYKLVVEGTRLSGNGAPGGGDTWFPSLHMDQQPAFSVKGSIGRLINIEINSEESFGTNLKEQLKITYKGEGDELEDDIIQEIEAGNTSLSLTGTSLTGYTESHKGLFGLKMRMRFGGLEVTTIASQEGGTQERQKLGVGTVLSDAVREERDIDLHRHFFLKLTDREAYGDVANWDGATQRYLTDASGRRPVRVFQYLQGNEEQTFKATATACPYNREGGVITERCETGRWKPMKEATDFYYDERMRMLTVPSGNRNMSIAVRWEGDFIGGTDTSKLILIHSRSAVGVRELDDLMWRNVYSISRIAKENKESFGIKMVKNADSTERNQNDSLTFVRRLGLEKPDKPGQINIDDQTLFNLEQGYMVLPCVAGISREDDAKNCLTPMKRVNPNTEIYDANVDEIQIGSTVHKFVISGKQRKSTFGVREASHSVSGSSCIDIEKDTEKLVLNGSTVLVRSVDYEVLYETGQITLLSPRAKDPNADIDISYECNPPFQIQDKILLGTRLEYKLDGISDESILGATLLYKSQSTSGERPELGREPFNQFLWGFNARLAGNPKWMTSMANLFPFVQTEAPSKANFEFEVAQSRYNPNTKESAYLDNFEGSENILSMPMHIYSWFKASPPAFDENGKSDENLDYRHQGQFIWHSSLQEPYSHIYGSTGNSHSDSRQQTLLELNLHPNDNLEGRSWGGVMRALPGQSNQSKKRTLEVVVYGRNGNLTVDMGQISEDISVPGLANGEPNGTLQSEINVGVDILNKNDAGLDGQKGSGEKGARWECKPTCYSVPLDSNNFDAGQDDYKVPLGATEESYHVNGTEGNNMGTAGYSYDTEDLDRSGVLDVKNTYLRYVMPLDSACNSRFHCEELRSGWRKYQIPLYGTGRRIGANAGEGEAQILSNVKIVRAWLGHLPSRISRSEILLARINLVGNAWEEGDRNREFEIDADRFATGDLKDSSAIRVGPAIPDSNRLQVGIINKQEERSYQPSPNTKIGRDTRTDEPMPERSLVLRYENLHRGEEVGATRLLGSEPKDLTLYDRLRMEIHPDSNSVPGTENYSARQNRISLGLRLGKDQGNRDSKDYYEIRIHMDTNGIYDKKHTALWNRNSFNIRMQDLSSLKNDPLYQGYTGRPISKTAWHEGRQDSSLTLSVVGNPTLSRVDWMRLVIYVDSIADTTQRGEIWVNDLRLEGVDHSLGSSMRTQLQLDFSDFVNVSGNLTYRNGGFTTMSETKATPANSHSTVDYNTNLTVFANKVFPDQWAVSLPLSMQYRGAISRPFTKPTSDVNLGGTGFMDIMRDISDGHLTNTGPDDSAKDIRDLHSRVYQTTVFEERFSTSYKKEHRSSNILTQVFLERPDLQYSYASAKRTEYFTLNRSRNYNTKVQYSLSPFENKSMKPLGFSQKWKYMPSFLSGVDFTPYPDKLNLTISDLSFVRTETLNKPRNQEDIPLNQPAQYSVEMTHGLDMEWRLLNFFNFGYRLAVDRDFDNDHACFDESFFLQEDNESIADPTQKCDGDESIFASNLVLDLDGQDRNPDHLGDHYGILYRERNRTQSFHADFNPNIFSWLTMGANFNSGFNQERNDSIKARYGDTILTPEHFQANADHDVKLNTSLSLPALFGPVGDGKGFMGGFRKRMEDWRLRNFDLSYSVGHKYNKEAFTYQYLDETTGWASYYAYQLGMIYGDVGNFLNTLFEGEPDPYWMDFLMPPDENLKNLPDDFNHQVNRTWDAGTGMTVPWVDLSMSLNVRYSKEYTLYRALKASDTSEVWPDITVTGTFNDFAAKIPFLRKTFRSMTSTTTFNLRKEDKRALFSQNLETEKISYKFDPLVRLAATTNKDVRGELSFKGGLEKALDFEKVPLPGKLPYRFYKVTTMTAYERTADKRTKRDAFNAGGDASIAYDVETQKGLQFWRYYVKLENNLRLKVTGSANYLFTERTLPLLDPKKDQEILTMTCKPEVSYNFTNNVDAMFYSLYKYDKLWHTPKEESTHELTVHGEFTMRF